MKKVFFILLFVITTYNLFSNDDLAMADSIKTESETIASDTNHVKEIKFAELTKSPLGAIARSLIVPGWGQIYVETYWKAPIFFGGAATLSYLIYKNHNDFVDFQKQLNKIEDKKSLEYYYMKNKRENARDNRDMAGFYLLGVYLISSIDAYVGAHLYDFSVTDDFSMAVLPNQYGGLSLNISFKK